MAALVIMGIVYGLGIVAGTICIYLGYRLYTMGVIQKGQLTAQGAGAHVTFKDFGPGVAFALFGAVIIAFSLTREMDQSVTTKSAGLPYRTIEAAPAIQSETATAQSAHPVDAQAAETVATTIARK